MAFGPCLAAIRITGQKKRVREIPPTDTKFRFHILSRIAQVEGRPVKRWKHFGLDGNSMERVYYLVVLGSLALRRLQASLKPCLQSRNGRTRHFTISFTSTPFQLISNPTLDFSNKSVIQGPRSSKTPVPKNVMSAYGAPVYNFL